MTLFGASFAEFAVTVIGLIAGMAIGVILVQAFINRMMRR